jgi:cytochrome c556
MRRSSTFNLVAGISIAMATAALAQGRPEGRPLRPQAGGVLAQRAPATGVRALANVRELHDIMISPASDAVFDATARQPLDEKGWTTARNQALVLGESGNLLMVGSRVRDNGKWMKMSRALVNAAAQAAAAAQKKDAKALEVATDAITVACMECHRPYRDQGRQMGAPR